jgi:hypothetical protein
LPKSNERCRQMLPQARAIRKPTSRTWIASVLSDAIARPCWHCFIINNCPQQRSGVRCEEKIKSLERRRSEAASFTRQSEAILYGHSKTAAPHAGLRGSESTDAAGALPVHAAAPRLESSTAALTVRCGRKLASRRPTFSPLSSQPSQGCNTGSNPVGSASESTIYDTINTAETASGKFRVSSMGIHGWPSVATHWDWRFASGRSFGSGSSNLQIQVAGSRGKVAPVGIWRSGNCRARIQTERRLPYGWR